VTVPSIKGSIFARAAEDVSKLVSSGRLLQAELRRILPEGDLAVLAQTIAPTGWYDVQIYGRLLDLLRSHEGRGENEYLRRRGARSAEALMEAGLYQQMEYLKRTEVVQQTDAKARFVAFGRDLRLLTTLHASILNFSKQTAKVDPDRPGHYIIETTDAAAMPESLCWTTDGFMNRMASGHGHGDLWRWERPSPDRVIYRMRRAP
jgi:hypothetical protein